MLHNLEEVIAIHFIDEPLFMSHIANTKQFIIAVSLFTLLGFSLVFWAKIKTEDSENSTSENSTSGNSTSEGRQENPKLYTYAVLGFSGMLFLNSFFPHILSALYAGSYTPGLFTATLLILPLTSYILGKTFQTKILSNKQLLLTIVLGGIGGIVLVSLFLGIGYVFSML